MKISINEIENLNSKLDRQGMRQKYDLTRKELKAIIHNYEEGKYPVNNGFIEVERSEIGMDTLSATSQKSVDEVGSNNKNASSSKGSGSSWKTQDGSFQAEAREEKSETPKGESKNASFSKENGRHWRVKDGSFQAEAENADSGTSKLFRIAVFFKFFAPAVRDIAQAVAILKEAFTRK